MSIWRVKPLAAFEADMKKSELKRVLGKWSLTAIGIGAIIIPETSIGKWVTIGAGAVVIRDVPDYAVVVGNPGKIIKYYSLNE